MKALNRKIYIAKELNESLKERSAHLEDGIADDPFIPASCSFNVSYNREFVKKTTRLLEFLKRTPDADVEKYITTNDEIRNENEIYPGLYSLEPKDSHFILYFVMVKNRIRDDEYYLLYAEAVRDVITLKNIKDDIAKSTEWKKDYILTDVQKKIASNENYNIVLGAAGTGKTDVAIHSYINNSPVDGIKDFSYRENCFITYSARLSEYVKKDISSFWDDYKNPIALNVFTSSSFFLKVLSDSQIQLPGYEIIKGEYVKEGIKKPSDSDYLSSCIVTVSDFRTWYMEGSLGMNKAQVPLLDKIIAKYGMDYPYLFYRGIYKGKIINKGTDSEAIYFLMSELKGSENEIRSLKKLMDNYAEHADDLDRDSFHEWYLTSKKRYQFDFKDISGIIKTEEDFYKAVSLYFDYAEPLREDKRCMEYYGIFEREAEITEGYRGETREGFSSEISVLYEMAKSFDAYLVSNHKYDDNDLCYYIQKNLDEILSKGNFKNILVDEFQDMTEREIHTLIRLLGDDDKGIIHIYGDFEQTINPTFLQLENIKTIYMVNGIEDYDTEILSSSFRYSSSICRELEDLRLEGRKLFGTEDEKNYLPLVSNVDKEFETGGNLLISKSLSERMLSKITAKNLDDIMYIVADDTSKNAFLHAYKVNPEAVFTVSESKGREADFVIVYNTVSDRTKEYENLFTADVSYSRANRIFYNQLYVGITRCRINFIILEDEERIGKKTKEVLEELITPLMPENVDLFTEELLSEKTNYYFRALESFRNLDFRAAEYNMSFYTGTDYDDLKGTLNQIRQYEKTKEPAALYDLSNHYKASARYDLSRVLYAVLDNSLMLSSLDIIERKLKNPEDGLIHEILTENKDHVSLSDIEAFERCGYFTRLKDSLKERIRKMREEM